MGGEWWFLIEKGKSNPKPEDTLNLKKYQSRLLDIRKEFKDKFNFSKYRASYTVEWSPDNVAAETNIFAKFTYICTRHTRSSHEQTVGLGANARPIATWKLFWNPSIVSGDDVCSDVHARCAPYNLIVLSVDIQKQLAIEFPKHFQLYLGDGIGGCGPAMDQVWGVKFRDRECANYDGREKY